MKTCMLSSRHAVAMLAMTSLMMLASGCGGVDEVRIKGESCPLPSNIADEDRHNIKKFSGDVHGIITSVAGVSAAGEIQGHLEKYYPAAHDVNRIYALSYAACVSCRMDPADVNGCAQRFDDIINANHAKREEAARTAEAYHKQVVNPLHGVPAK
jgi:hypothetical protein